MRRILPQKIWCNRSNRIAIRLVEDISMKILCAVLLLSSAFVLAQDNGAAKGDNSHRSKGDIDVTGCVSRANSDYVLMKENITYQLQTTGKLRLRGYLGHRVEITGYTSPTLSTSSDAMNKVGSASSITLNIKSIKTINKDCSEPAVPR
jgi:hypothetical protein